MDRDSCCLLWDSCLLVVGQLLFVIHSSHPHGKMNLQPHPILFYSAVPFMSTHVHYNRSICGRLPGAGHAWADAEDLPHEVVPLDGRGDAQGRCGVWM